MDTIYRAPAEYGTTPCEYTAKCTAQTDMMIKLPFGLVPICESHLRFYQTH